MIKGFIGNGAFLMVIAASIIYPLFQKPHVIFEGFKAKSMDKLSSNSDDISPKKNTSSGFNFNSLICSTLPSAVALNPYFLGFYIGSVLPLILYFYQKVSMDEDLQFQKRLESSEKLQRLVELWIESGRSKH